MSGSQLSCHLESRGSEAVRLLARKSRRLGRLHRRSSFWRCVLVRHVSYAESPWGSRSSAGARALSHLSCHIKALHMYVVAHTLNASPGSAAVTAFSTLAPSPSDCRRIAS